MLGFFGEFLQYFRSRRKIWLIPVVIVSLILGALLVLGGSGGAFAPFIYAVF